MAYCVRCGVKLEEGADVCPLCGTEVLLPSKMSEQKAPPLFPKPLPNRGSKGLDKTRKGIVELIITLSIVSELTVFLSLWLSGNLGASFIPLFCIAMATIALCLGLLASHSFSRQASLQGAVLAILVLGLDLADFVLSWSLIVLPSLGLFWMVVVYPSTKYWRKKGNRAWAWLILSPYLYLAFLNWVLAGNFTWFVPVALPAVTCLFATSALMLVWFSNRKNKRIPLADLVLAFLVVVFLSCTAFDLSLTHYQIGYFALRWSTSLLVAGLVILLFLVSVSISRRLRRYFTSHTKHR
ncbi:MAG: hypothetical protein AB7C91_03685 [Sphaerochaeta sp.]|uniref:hypothetical protein n=1 Tax=Sphaerochaeta sp. TaxID=1972642 RepID=UPI003D1081E5